MSDKSKKTNVNIISLGCSKNTVDSEQLMFQLKSNGAFVNFNSNKVSDIVLINTCGFIGDAKEESINQILRVVDAKKSGIVQKIIVFGCLAQRYKNQLLSEIPEVDFYAGTNQMNEILNYLGYKLYNNYLPFRLLSTPRHYGYLKIAEGCNRSCSFCAIPIMRGKYQSKPAETILAEARFMASKGVKEIILIAQDLSFYGYDMYGKSKLADLLLKLSRIKEIEWIRLHYIYPKGFPDDVLDVIATNSKLCKYLDIPFQHISDNMLRLMKRNITKKQTYSLIEKIKNKIPDICLRTSLMVGFPGEKTKDFRELTEFVDTVKFHRLGVFKYSHEEDTYAYKNLKDNISPKTKSKRFEILLEKQYQISLQHNTTNIGKVIKVIADRYENSNTIGRTEYDSPEIDNEVIIQGKFPLHQFYQVKIVAASAYDLTGEIQNNL